MLLSKEHTSRLAEREICWNDTTESGLFHPSSLKNLSSMNLTCISSNLQRPLQRECFLGWDWGSGDF